MKKTIQFVLFIFLGIVYLLSGSILSWALIFTPVSLSFMDLVDNYFGLLLLLFTIIFLVLKKKGFGPILGLFLGYIIGFILLTIGLGLGGM